MTNDILFENFLTADFAINSEVLALSDLRVDAFVMVIF